MARTSCHARSISLPSRPHPVDAGSEDQFSKLRAWAWASNNYNGASYSASSIAHTLSCTKDLYEQVKALIELPLNQQALALAHRLNRDSGVEEVLEGSLCLLDLCAFTLDLLSQLKELVIELQSSIRRRRDGDLCLANYIAFRKKANKTISKCFISLREMEKKKKKKEGKSCKTEIMADDKKEHVVRMLKEVESVSLWALKSVLVYVSEPRERGWSTLVSKWNSMLSRRMIPTSLDPEVEENDDHVKRIFNAALVASCRSSIDNNLKVVQSSLNRLKSLEFSIHQLVDGLESVSRCIVRTRVSLLNANNHV
ncbi:hypothetical protein Dimus_023586 [Dionaea muscipula]